MQYQDSFICFNPYCKTNRFTQHNDQKCMPWIYKASIEKQKDLSQNSMKFRHLVVDYLKKPLESIDKIGMIQMNLKQMLASLREYIHKFMDKSLSQLYNKLEYFFNFNINLRKKMKDIQVSADKSKDFDINLIQDLKKIQKLGEVLIYNQHIIKQKINFIQHNILSLERGFFIIENPESVQQRRKQFIHKKQVQEYLVNIDRNLASQRYQQIASLIGVKQPDVQATQEITVVNCALCNQQITLKKNSLQWQEKIKQRRKIIKIKYLEHCYNSHMQIMEYHYMSKKFKLAYEIDFKFFLQELENVGKSKFMIIDRQNANTFEIEQQNYSQYYVLEIISQNSYNLARDKYIVAASKQRDAADLLSVAIIFQIAKKYPSRQIYLVTKDHYGHTLEQVFMGIGINFVCWGNDLNEKTILIE